MSKMRDDERAIRLSKRTFSAADLIAATGITSDKLTNYLAKSKIRLCSVSFGQGNSREFYLLDVYLIAIMSALALMTKNSNWSARTLEYLLFLPEHDVQKQSQPLRDGCRLPEVRQSLINDIRTAKEMFWKRSCLESSWILLIDEHDVKNNLYGYNLLQADRIKSNSALFLTEKGIYLNVTQLLWEVDNNLALTIGEDT